MGARSKTSTYCRGALSLIVWIPALTNCSDGADTHGRRTPSEEAGGPGTGSAGDFAMAGAAQDGPLASGGEASGGAPGGNVPDSCADVVCAAADECHESGECDPATGTCSSPAKADGTDCDDADACSQQDRCEDGACVGRSQVVCVAEACHEPGVCDPATGQCSPAMPIVGCAPAVDPTVATTVFESTRFLYEGLLATQTGVEDGAIDPVLVAVVRGRALSRDGNPLHGVSVRVAGHPEFGATLTQDDGYYNLAVNGGSQLVDFSGPGLLPAHRHVTPGWQAYALLQDVVLIGRDTKSTTVEMSASTSAIQTAEASPVTDEWGTRQTAMLFAAGTTAWSRAEDGSTSPLTSLTVRATEYTVGLAGPETMPAELPPASAYTHAFEISVDEALGQQVEFSSPVIAYVENFLDFPVGTAVPLGYYDRATAAWVASENGVIIKIVNVVEGEAVVSFDVGDSPASEQALASHGMTSDERDTLGARYSVGQSLWRMPLSHFSTWDSNWGWGPPVGATPPDSEDPAPNCNGGCNGPNGPVGGTGAASDGGFSPVNQTSHQSLPIVGTPFSLNYLSSRVPGYSASRTIEMRVTGSSLPEPLKEVVVQTEVAGSKHTEHLTPSPNLSYSFTWDRKDAYGRTVQGQQDGVVRVGYTYEGSYAVAPRFGYSGNGARITGERDAASPGRLPPVTLWKEHHLDHPRAARFNSRDELSQGLGGWSLSVHHNYDPVGRVLYLGTGDRIDQSVVPGGTRINVNRIPCNYCAGTPVDGANIRDVQMSAAADVLALGDGGLVFSQIDILWRVSRDGVVQRLVGGGEGAPAESAFGRDVHLIATPQGLTLGRDGTIFFVDGSVIRRVDSDGVLHTVAGSGEAGFSPDGVSALQARFGYIADIALGADQSLYLSDYSNNRVRRVTPEGLLATVAGTGISAESGDGGPAALADVDRPGHLAIGRDDTLFVATRPGTYGHATRIRRISPDGVISHYAGGCDSSNCKTGPGSLASNTIVEGMSGMAMGPDEKLYYSQGGYYLNDDDRHPGHNVWRVNAEGRLEIVIGGTSQGRVCPDDRPAIPSCFGQIGQLDVARDGTVYVLNNTYWDGQTQFDGTGIVSVKPQLPGFQNTEIVLPSPDGGEHYVFTTAGRHIETRDALTGMARFMFGYDARGQLSTVTDRDGRITTLVRHASTGMLQQINSPDGQSTLVALDARGYLEQLTDPEGNSFHLQHSPDGLLTAIADPRGHFERQGLEGWHQFEYDALGRLVHANDPRIAVHDLTRTTVVDGTDKTIGHQVERTGPDSLQTTHHFTQGPASVSYTDVDGAGLQSTFSIGLGGQHATSLADGTYFTMSRGKDGISGAADAPQSWLLATPAGRSRSVALSRLASRNGDGSLINATEDYQVNGRHYVSTYEAATRRWTRTSPALRQSHETLDEKGRVVKLEVPGLEPVSFGFDSAGRLSSIHQGTAVAERVTTIAYDAAGFVERLVEPQARETTFVRDLNGRVLSQFLPGGPERLVDLSYDENGNVESVTPPGRPAHLFLYSAVNQLESYGPPSLNNVNAPETTYKYELDRQVEKIVRPEGLEVGFEYDTARRLARVNLPEGNGVAAEALSFVYDAGTGHVSAINRSNGIGLDFLHDGFLVIEQRLRGLRQTPIVLARTYDNDFRPASESVDGAFPVSFTFDADGLLTAVGALELEWNSQNGLFIGTSLGVTSDAWTYNGFAEPLTYASSVGGSEVFRMNFGRDALGRITQKVETIDGITSTFDYEYDAAGRLAIVKKDDVEISDYTYDVNGNRLSAVTALPQASSDTATYDDQDRLLTYGPSTFTYTDNGELLSKIEAGKSTSYAYDVLGALRSVELPDGRMIEYLVDGFGRRVGKKIDGTLVQAFIYGSQLAPVAELDGEGNIVSRFVYGTDINVPEYFVRGNATYRVVTDHLGSPRAIIDTTSGIVVQRLDYDEWGVVLADTNPGFQPFGFAGGLYDGDTKLVRFGARDYDAKSGRWTAKDPANVATWTNGYEYAASDGVNLLDPDGFAPKPRNFWRDDVGSIVTDLLRRFGRGKVVSAGCKYPEGVVAQATEGLIGPGIASWAAARLIERPIAPWVSGTLDQLTPFFRSDPNLRVRESRNAYEHKDALTRFNRDPEEW
jgi:RHS repeat-associated protein